MHRILVVDDDIETAGTLGRCLALGGFEVSVCGSGRGAMRRLSEEAFDSIVLDLRLGDLDGLDVLRDMRAQGSAMPAIILTGFATITAAVEATKLGAEFCEKPVDPECLSAILRRMIDAHLAQRLPPPLDRVARWSNAVAAAVMSHHDPRTLEMWAGLIGASVPTLRGWCRTAGVGAKTSLDFARLVRAQRLAVEDHRTPEYFIDAADIRTTRRLLARTVGLVEARDIDAIIDAQTIITDAGVLGSVRLTIRNRSAAAAVSERPR